MTKSRRVGARLLVGGLLVVPFGLGGCSGGLDGVELNGKIFDALGVSGSASGRRDEPKVAARAPLVLPPDPNRLPDPGSAAAPVVTGAVGADPAWPKDRDQIKAADAANAKQRQDEYCKNKNWKEKAHGNEIEANAGPEGSCTGSIFSVMSKTLFGNSE